MLKRCSGCGVILQTEDDTKAGFVKDLSHELCLDCFNLKNYSKVNSVTIHPGEMPVIKEEALILYVLSINHLSLRLKYRLDRHFPNSPVILVLNHIDTLDSSVNLNKMIQKIRQEANKLQMKFVDIVPISALQNKYIDVLMESMEYHQKNRNVYLVGFQNSGKSLLFKRIANRLAIETTVLSGKKPGLTLADFSIPFHGAKLTDTPGIYLPGSIASFLPFDAYKDLLIESRVKPKIYQLNEQQSLFFGGLCAVSYLEGGFKGIACYASNALEIHRTKYDETYEKFKSQQDTFKHQIKDQKFVKKLFKLNPDIAYELAISDFAMVHLKGKAVIEVYLPDTMRVVLEEALY
ncbi:50S ribosome-binding GTPase [Acholeplasma vituli]|uniref:50S ribosome-binding GTPase n=1 Tax=Paracholeplasma vituli TaxID=69473 RepID=A0ABT2PWP8_9MOLU|nr:GTPase [Paracholeplasma vituli]MCU0105388.1 50S ribosome-binding GTPase [Paracholeplasma vituli]